MAQCLDSVFVSCADIEVEVIVAEAGKLVDLARVNATHPAVKLITLPATALVPRLWAEGIVQSRGGVVALTLSECTAGKDWGTSILAAMAKGSAAAGGPISLSASATMLDSAVFFLRYSAFMSEKSMENRQTVEIAGDNAAYARTSLELGGWSRRSGFWEVDVNELLRKRGDDIAWVPAATMEFANAGSLSTLSHRRYEHGRLFGHARAASRGESPLRIALAAPFVPLVLMTRAVRRVWEIKQYRTKLAKSLPAFAWLSACWAFGEAVGAIEAGIANRR
ncbi:MAG: hypothetical protein ABJC63_01450 [Gemmatimonadales bacterium]